MRSLPRPASISFGIASALLMLATGAVSAQTGVPANAQPVQDADTPITVTPKSQRENSTTVQREGGRITQETVHSGGSTYTVTPANPNSTQLPGDAGGPQVRGPKWTVLEFDTNKKQKQRSADAAAEAAAENTADVPPPPPMPPAAR